ncbi:MAG: DUF6062 family protein [Candidatus Omnitrophica bacterium]|nr:DUF6062 family protein [Candidatus Omnitrophota bacterium]
MTKNPEKHSPYFNLKDALKEKHCPLCFLARKSVTRFFDNLLYERVNDPEIRGSLRLADGFCQKHFWQLLEFQDATGISAVARGVLEFAVETWSQNPKGFSKRRRAKVLCPACAIWHETEENYLGLFLENLNDPPIMVAYEHSFGFCLIHFMAVYSKVEDKEKRTKLLKIQMSKMESLIKELADFERKHTYEFRHEGFGKEADSRFRAVELLKGCSDLLRDWDEFKRKI